MNDQINQQVNVILLKRIIELLDTKEPPIESVSVDNLDVVSASLRNELAKVVKSIKDLPDNADVIKELKKLTAAISAIDIKPTINVAAAEVTIPDIKVPDITIPSFDIPTPQVNYTAPDIHIPAPVVNLPAPIVNIPTTDLDPIIRALEAGLNKLRTNSETRPLAVRMSDGQKWVKELQQLNRQAAQTTQFMSDVSYIRNAAGLRINPATDEGINQIAGNEAMQVDDVSTTSVTYVGVAPIGTSVGSAGWKIKKIDESGSPITTVVTWAGGGSYSQIWSNRTSLTYA